MADAPTERHPLRQLQLLIDDFNWTLSHWPIETDEHTHFVIDKTAEQTVFLQETLPFFRDLVRGGIDSEISDVLGSPAGRWGCRLLQLVFRGLELARFFVDRGPVPKEGSDCEDEKAELQGIRKELSEMAANVEYILDVKVGQIRSKRTSKASLKNPAESINPSFIRIATAEATETSNDAAHQIEAITGIAYPPTTQANWVRLCRLAGFSMERTEQVLKDRGYDGFDDVDELPRRYVSAKASISDGNGLEVPSDTLFWTQAILAGLEPLRQKSKPDNASPPIVCDEKTTKKTDRLSKRSTQRGDAKNKLIAALTKHHDYSNGSCLNLEPIGNNQLARLADVSTGSASNFFRDNFGGIKKYEAICREPSRLGKSLKALNNEYSPLDLYGNKPPGEDDFEDE